MWRLTENKNWDVIKHQFSWVRDMTAVPQDAIHHAEGDVEVHTQMVINSLLHLSEYQELDEQNKEILWASALMHDIEKRSTTVMESDGRITSAGHAKKGEKTVRVILYCDIPTPFAIREQIAKLVRYHGLPLWIFEKPNPQKALLAASLEVDTKLLVILAKADVLGRICADQEELLYKIELFKALCEEQGVWGKAKHFSSNLAKFNYFQKEDVSHDYVPFEEESFEVIMMSGLPGTGKDTYLKKYYKSLNIISLDDIRRKNSISPTDKSGNGRVVQIAKEKAREFLRKKESFAWNATNTSRQMREQLIDLFTTYGAKIKIIYLEVPFKKLMSQNRNREYAVPDSVLLRLMERLEIPTDSEGHEVLRIVE
jgi:predicted kinase